MAPTKILLSEGAKDNRLHPKFIRDEDERPKVAYDQFSDDIPVISLAGEREEVRRRVVAACEDWGIFQVVDHGVELGVVEKMSSLAREFFALPVKEKLRFDMSGGKRGGFIVSSHLQVFHSFDQGL